jgi:S-layer homology domain
MLALYSDRAQIPTYATNAVAAATQQRMVVNYPQVDRLNPMRDVTRAEVAAFIYQALVARNETTALNSPYIVLPPTTAPSLFSDLQNHWAKDFIVGLASKGLIGGFQDNTFRPDTTMTRAQYAALIAKAFDPPSKRSPLQFTDVPETFWGYDAIQQAYQGEFLSGISPNTFAPNANIQRLQLIVSLVSGLELSGGSSSVLARYTDLGDVPLWARGSVATATQRGIVVNYPARDRLNPLKDATRGEVAAMVYQALADAGTVPQIKSAYTIL